MSFTPTDQVDFKSVTASVSINVVPPPPPVAVVVSETPVFRCKLNKNGKPTGKAVLSGFTLEFNTPLAASAVSNANNYQIDTVTTKKEKNALVRVLHPLKNVSVSYTAGSDVVTLNLKGDPTFVTGGLLTVLPG